MVGEFPKLQGVMVRYYVLHDCEPPEVAVAVRNHYAPKGPADTVLSAAVFAAGADDDIVRLLARIDAVTAVLGSEDGANLLTAYRRAATILRIEGRKDGPHDAPPDRDLLGNRRSLTRIEPYRRSR